MTGNFQPLPLITSHDFAQPPRPTPFNQTNSPKPSHNLPQPDTSQTESPLPCHTLVSTHSSPMTTACCYHLTILHTHNAHLLLIQPTIPSRQTTFHNPRRHKLTLHCPMLNHIPASIHSSPMTIVDTCTTLLLKQAFVHNHPSTYHLPLLNTLCPIPH